MQGIDKDDEMRGDTTVPRGPGRALALRLTGLRALGAIHRFLRGRSAPGRLLAAEAVAQRAPARVALLRLQPNARGQGVRLREVGSRAGASEKARATTRRSLGSRYRSAVRWTGAGAAMRARCARTAAILGIVGVFGPGSTAIAAPGDGVLGGTPTS